MGREYSGKLIAALGLAVINKRADNGETTQHEPGLSYDGMNTHEQTDSPGQNNC